MNALIHKYRIKLNNNLHFKEILIGSANTLVLKILGVILAFGVTLIISRQYGAEGVGLYNLSVRTITILALISTLGINTSILRYVGQFNNKESQHKLKLLFKHSIQFVLPTSILFGILLFTFSGVIADRLFHNIKYLIPLQLFAFLLPFMAILNICVEYIRGLNAIKTSETLRSISRAVVNIILLLILGVYIHNYLLPIFTFMVGVIVSLLISLIFIFKKIGRINMEHMGGFTKKELIKTSLPIFVSTLLIFLTNNLSSYFLEIYSTTNQVGIFSVCIMINTLISLVLITVNTITAPKFSELFWNNQKDTLQKVVFHSAKLIFFLSLIPIILIIIFSKLILGFFGEEFVEGQLILAILLIGHFISSATGSVGILLNMIGYQKILRNILIFSLPIIIILNLSGFLQGKTNIQFLKKHIF